MTDFSNNKISHLISSQVPFFVRNDHQTFVSFIEAYYRFLEQNDEVVNRIKNFPNFYDVDESEEPFLSEIYAEYLKLVPSTAIVDKALLTKHIKDFYRARGTEKSIRFLLQILFNKSADIYYPKQDILRASDGKWYIQKSIRVGDFFVDNVQNATTATLNHFVSKTITGASSNTHAIVESVDLYYRLGVLIQELSISNLDGDFQSGEQVYTFFTENDSEKRISANIRSGSIEAVTINDGGSGYAVGYSIPIVGGGGDGGVIKIGAVTTGNLLSVFVENGGAGFKNGDNVLVSSGSGSGAAANVQAINPSGSVHPNTYNIISSIIDLVANTRMNTASYTTLNNANANVAIQNACTRFDYGPCGPLQTIRLIASGSGYDSIPTFDVDANTRIRNLGILGRMEIVAGGLNYQVGNYIQFWGGLGFGANAIVAAVAGNGAITNVQFQAVSGQHVGGSGYTQGSLPLCNVVTGTGSGANVVVTAILGDGEELSGGTGTIGEITRVDIIDGGTSYNTSPTLDLTGTGDGLANVTATVIRGLRTYPGRYLNDDGHLSGYNFLEDRDFYQNYSYVVRVEESISKYRQAAVNLTHPAGTKMFGQHLHERIELCETVDHVDTNTAIFVRSPYTSVKLGVANSNVAVWNIAHGLTAGANVYLEFIEGDTINISNGLFVVTTANANAFFILHPNVSNTSGNTMFGKIVYR